MQKQSADDCVSKSNSKGDEANILSKYVNRNEEKRSSYNSFMHLFKSSKKKTNGTKMIDEETKSVQSNSSSSNNNKNVIS